MSLIGDLADLYATEAGVVEGSWESTSTALAPRAARQQPQDFGPPIEYTLNGQAPMQGWGGNSITSQLQLSLAESTLFSVLELISKKTSAAKWNGVRRVRNPRPDAEPVVIPPGAGSLAVDLWHQPNPFMSGKRVRQVGTWHLRAVGRAWFVVDYYDAAMSLPRSWWPVRPDRMAPNLDADKFIDGYTYTSPDGYKVPLDQREVLQMVNPHPIDVWDGIGVVQTLARIVGTSLTTEQWVEAFFANDATPGGYIEYPEELEESDYQRIRRRWNEQHRGVSKAHRIGLIEMAGKFTPAAYSIKDLQFPEIRHLTRDQILEAFRIHKHNMGISEDVNRASAFAALEQLAENELEPNLKDWYELGQAFLSRFGVAGEAVDLCYESPRPEDKEEERADRSSKVNDYVALVNAGVEPAAAQEFLGLPELPLVSASDDGEKVADPAGETSPVAGELDETRKGDPSAVAVTAQKLYLSVEGGVLLTREEGRRLLVEAGADIDPEAWDVEDKPVSAPVVDDMPGLPGLGQDEGRSPVGTPETGVGGQEQGVSVAATLTRPARPRAQASDVDLAPMDDEWKDILTTLLSKWPAVLEEQYGALARQVRDAVNDGNLDGLLELITPDAGAQDTLLVAMIAAATVGASAVVREADEQDVQIGARVPERAELDEQAGIVTGLMRAGLAVAAGQAAMRVLVPGASGEDIAEQVREHLDSLTDAEPKRHLGGALTQAQNGGRFETLAVAPDATYFASEQLDNNTCGPCRRVDGKRYETLEESKEDYPTSGYRKCEGLERCRGTVVAVWNEDREEGDDE